MRPGVVWPGEPREGDMMFTGAGILAVAVVVLAAIWALVLYGSTYFGPREE
jgi:hypothetical protein